MATKKENKITFKNGHGKMYVKATFNTTYVSFTDEAGNVVCWSAAGTCGFNGARRSTSTSKALVRVGMPPCAF